MPAVVGAAIVRAGRVLAARRTEPPELAGLWEFPGGKVEAGEGRAQALVREIAEELGVTVRLEHWLEPEVDIPGGWTLTVGVARLVAGTLTPTEHDELRWLGPDELGEVRWGDPDVPFLPEVEALLRGATGPRGIFFDEDDARAVVARLVAGGYTARAERERLAGEDDDEDHPWAVLTDAPELVLDVLVDEFDGWLDVDEQRDAPGAPPPELPSQPRRVKGVGEAQ